MIKAVRAVLQECAVKVNMLAAWMKVLDGNYFEIKTKVVDKEGIQIFDFFSAVSLLGFFTVIRFPFLANNNYIYLNVDATMTNLEEIPNITC